MAETIKREETLGFLRELENDIRILTKRICKAREAERTMDDEALYEWDKQNGDLEDGLKHIRLF